MSPAHPPTGRTLVHVSAFNLRTTQSFTSIRIQGPEGGETMPRPVNLPQSGSGRILRAAGTENADVRTQISTGRRNAQRGREPSSTYQPHSERHAPQTAGTANEASTSPGQEIGHRASSQSQTSDPPGTEPGTTASREYPRPRNVPREALTQPRRQKQSLRIASLNMNGTGSKMDDKWGAINNVMKQRKC